MVELRQHSDRKLVREVPHGLLGAVAERQMRVFPGVQSAFEMTDEISPLVAGRTKPRAARLVEHGIEEHQTLDHAPRRSGLPESVVRLTHGRPERLVMHVEHPASMELSRRDRGRESSFDKSLDEVGALLAVDDAGERAVLTLHEDAGMEQYVHEKPCLPLGEAERRDRVDALGVCDVDRPSVRRRRKIHRSRSSASRE
jgi:hypothetical protein